MSKQKTKPSTESVEVFLDKIEDEKLRDDCHLLVNIMKKITKSEPVLWGGSIIGFGRYHYKYESGHEGYSCLTGFSPRKQSISIYLMAGFADSELLNQLGKYKAAKGCLYVKRLDDISKPVLEQLIRQSVDFLRVKYPAPNNIV